MTTFLLLVLVQISTSHYQTTMAPMESMDQCLTQLAVIAKQIPAQEGISYSLSCITVRATTEAPA